MVLTPQVVDAVAPAPVLAAGGIANGRQMAAALALGAEGVWTGSIWLTIKESDLQPAVVQRVLQRHVARHRPLARHDRQARPPAPHRLDRRLGRARIARHAADAAAVHGDRRGLLAHVPCRRRGPRLRGAQLAGTPIGQIAGMLNTVRPVRDVIFDMVEQYAPRSSA